jgi:glycosyltransferase involved in cell wall biosynthesis
VRILAVADVWFPDHKGGSARVAAETARRLADRGHDVTVLAPRTPGLPPDTVEGTSLRVLRTLPRTSLPSTATDVAATAMQSRRLIRGRFDVALGHQVTNAAGLALAGLGAPVVLAYHASAAREAGLLRTRLAPGTRRAWTGGLEATLAGLERFAVGRAARVLVLSAHSAGLVVEDHPGAASRVRRVSGGVDTARFSPADGRTAARRRLAVELHRPLLLAVRRLDHRLGLEELLEAVRQLSDPRVLVAVAGAGPLRERLEQLRQRLGLESRLRFLGAPAPEELADWYRAADVMVLPPARHEGFGLATVEALASGTPVVASPTGATPELLGPLEPRLIAADTGPEALTEAIRRALELAGPELSQRCRAYAVTRYSWDAVITGWEDALLEVAGYPRLRDDPLSAPL